MYIDLTDHLRCPASHPEAFLVLLPSRMDGRRVVAGELGCPVCGLVIELQNGVAGWEGAVPSEGTTGLTPEAIAAFLGLTGPGGFIALSGAATTLAPALAALLPGIRMALVNPPAGVADREEASVLRSPDFPLKSGSMRGVVVGADAATNPEFVAAAARSVLPGLRVVCEGGEVPPGVEEMARSDEVWVGLRGRH